MIDAKFLFQDLSYRSPVMVRGASLEKNRFLKVTVLQKDYFLSVLPNFHDTSLEEISHKMQCFFSSYELNFSGIDFSKKFFNLVGGKDPLDSFLTSIMNESLFNIEAVLLGILRDTHPHLFQYEKVLINQLYKKDCPLDFYKDSDCLKIKISPGKAAETIQVINDLHAMNSQMAFRLDGNKRFELPDMINFEEELQTGLSVFAFKRIDYVEEPFKNFYDTFLFEKRSKLTVAIDESYKNYMDHYAFDLPAVIKPSLIGISPVHSWLRSHEDKRAIISSSFEHPTVLLSLEFLARMRPYEFHGLENFFS